MVNRHIKNLILYKLVVVEGATPVGTARAENPFFSGVSRKGRKTKIVTSCDNVFLTNVLLAWSRARGKRPPVTEYAVKYTF